MRSTNPISCATSSMLPSAGKGKKVAKIFTRISGMTLFPGVSNGKAPGVIPDAVVLVSEGRFSYAGPREGAPDTPDADDIRGEGMLLMPALVNAHSHSPMTLLRGAGADLPLHDWLFKVIFPLEAKMTAAQAKAGMELAMLEHLRCGVTTLNEMYMFPEVMAEAAGKAGMRALITNACVDFGRGREQLDSALGFFREYHGSFEGRVRASISIHAEYTSTPELVRSVVRETEGLDNVVHVHVSETEKEVMECRAQHGRSPVGYFHDLGLFAGRAIAAHCVSVDEDDLNLLAGDGVTVALNPISNLKLGSGIAPVKQMREKGIRLAIGTDGAASNDSLDLFQEIKLTGILHKGVNHDPTLLHPAEVLEAASLSAAGAMGFEKLGLIREGWQADCVLIDMNAANLLPAFDIPAVLVYAAKGENVRMTMAQGKVLYRDGAYLTLDEERVKRDALQAAFGLAKAANP